MVLNNNLSKWSNYQFFLGELYSPSIIILIMNGLINLKLISIN